MRICLYFTGVQCGYVVSSFTTPTQQQVWDEMSVTVWLEEKIMSFCLLYKMISAILLHVGVISVCGVWCSGDPGLNENQQSRTENRTTNFVWRNSKEKEKLLL